MKKLLDTTFHIHFLTNAAEVAPYLAAHEDTATEFITSTIVMKELAVGVHYVEDDPSLATLRADFGWVEILPFSIRHAYCGGEIEAHFHRQGMPQDERNALGGEILIGGVARAEGATVVTRNTDDFDPMPGVDVESY